MDTKGTIKYWVLYVMGVVTNEWLNCQYIIYQQISWATFKTYSAKTVGAQGHRTINYFKIFQQRIV